MAINRLKILLFIILLIVCFYYIKVYINNRNKSFFEHFYSTNIEDTLEYSKIGYHGVVFKLSGSEIEFVFYPVTSALNDNILFYDIAKKGCLVVKPAYSDTIKIRNNNKSYLYTFRKF